MQIFKRLFVDKITKDFDPSKDITLGPWCFNNEKSLEEIKKYSENKVFLEDKTSSHTEAYRCCELQHSRIIDELSKYFRLVNKNKFSEKLCKNYITYWLYFFTHFIHYSLRHIQQYIDKYSDTEIELILFYKPKNIIFSDTNDFQLKCVNCNFFSNFLLYLISQKKPKKWNNFNSITMVFSKLL